MLEIVHSSEIQPLVYLAQKSDKRRFRWLDVLQAIEFPRLDVVKDSDHHEPFSIEKLANSIGAAFLDSRLAVTFGSAVSRMNGELDEQLARLFDSPERRNVERAVLETLADLRDRGAVGVISTQGIRETVVSALHRLDPDAAEAYTTSRAIKISERREDGELKVVRRNNQITPFNVTKVQAAIAKAFLASGEDPSPALILAQQVAERIRQERPVYLHIEVIQDYVQAALMRANYFRVAERYIAYRARRALMRDLGRESEKTRSQREGQQEELFSRGAGLELVDRVGRPFLWDPRELEARLDFSLTGLQLPISREALKEELMRSVRSGLSRDDFDRTILLNAKALLEQDPDYALVAGRILLTYIYEEVLGWNIVFDGIGGLKAKHERYFVEYYVTRGVELERLNPELAKFDLKKLAEALDPSSDLDFDLLSIQSLYDRYLIIDRDKKPQVRLEVPQIMWMRVAMGLSLLEKNREETAIEIYNLYRRKLFCSSTPTLFNSGLRRSQLSSCYLYWIDDTIESIMNRGIAENAFLCKWAGGLGGSWTAVRGTGAAIKGTNGLSSGVIPFLKMHNDQLVAVNQGGKRKGAGCAYLEVWHSDIFEFLDLRKNVGDERRRTHDMNTACWIPDLFMQRVNERGYWTLFHSSEVPDLHEIYGAKFKERYELCEALAEAGKIWGKKVPALDLWKKMLLAIFETGHPWFTFKDPCNVRSPQDHCGVVHSSNLCTEITLNTGPDETAVCNLGSLVLPSFFKGGELDRELLRSTVRLAVRMLDNVIDINFYPTEAARRSNLLHRPIGLGVMGLQDVLYIKRLPFDSDEAMEFTDALMEQISYFAFEASSELAIERGKYETYKGSKWDRGLLPIDTVGLLEKERGEAIEVSKTVRLDWDALRKKIKAQGMRNSNVLAIAPTATISNIMTSVPCIEPMYKHLYVESNLSGNFIMLNRALVEELKKLGIWDRRMIDDLKYFDGQIKEIDRIPDETKRLFATAFDINVDYIIRGAAERQKWIDQSQSTNLYSDSTDMRVFSHIYKLAWKSGLKTTYYLRTKAASGIDKATLERPKEKQGKLAPTEAEVRQCSLEAAARGEICESCQ